MLSVCFIIHNLLLLSLHLLLLEKLTKLFISGLLHILNLLLLTCHSSRSSLSSQVKGFSLFVLLAHWTYRWLWVKLAGDVPPFQLQLNLVTYTITFLRLNLLHHPRCNCLVHGINGGEWDYRPLLLLISQHLMILVVGSVVILIAWRCPSLIPTIIAQTPISLINISDRIVCCGYLRR